MKPIAYEDIKDQILVDIRPASDYQAGHIRGSIQLSPKNWSTYSSSLLDLDQALVFVVNQAEDLEELAEVVGITGAAYLLIGDLADSERVESQTISAQDFLDLDGAYTLLDVRHPDEITRPAPKKNLVNIPLEDLPHQLEDLPRDQTIFTLCGSGNRGTTAASFLIKEGFDAVIIKGGMKAIQSLSDNQ